MQFFNKGTVLVAFSCLNSTFVEAGNIYLGWYDIRSSAYSTAFRRNLFLMGEFDALVVDERTGSVLSFDLPSNRLDLSLLEQLSNYEIIIFSHTQRGCIVKHFTCLKRQPLWVCVRKRLKSYLI